MHYLGVYCGFLGNSLGAKVPYYVFDLKVIIISNWTLGMKEVKGEK